MCKGYCHPTRVCGISPAFFFRSGDLLYVCQGTNSWGVWLSLRNFSAIIFLALCWALLSTSPCTTVTYYGQSQHVLTVKVGEKNSNPISGFSFLMMDDAEKRRWRGEVNRQRAVSAGKEVSARHRTRSDRLKLQQESSMTKIWKSFQAGRTVKHGRGWLGVLKCLEGF